MTLQCREFPPRQGRSRLRRTYPGADRLRKEPLPGRVRQVRNRPSELIGEYCDPVMTYILRLQNAVL